MSLIRKNAEFVMLNACTFETSGLDHGKAGAALVLFEAANMLDDDFMENEACKLLHEALLCNTEAVGFESGSSGIGFVLLYLIKYGFIEADFEELWEDNKTSIIIEKIETETSEYMMLDLVETLKFFSLLVDVSHRHEVDFARITEKMHQAMQKVLTQCCQICFMVPRFHVQKMLIRYLQTMRAIEQNIPCEVQNCISEIFRSNLLAMSPTTEILWKRTINVSKPELEYYVSHNFLELYDLSILIYQIKNHKAHEFSIYSDLMNALRNYKIQGMGLDKGFFRDILLKCAQSKSIKGDRQRMKCFF